MRKILNLLLILVVLISSVGLNAADRITPKKPKQTPVIVRFNGDYLKGFYTIIDSRTDEEKAEAKIKKSLPGNLIVYMPGHDQRSNATYPLTSELSMSSKSGIVIAAVTDTPFGKDSNWRGDKAKDIIIMEIIRYALRDLHIEIAGYQPINDMPITVNDVDMKKVTPLTDPISTKITVTGWSHGGLLARRFAAAYSDSIEGMGVMCPAGYAVRGWDKSCTGPTCIGFNFIWESFRCGAYIFTGSPLRLGEAGFSMTKGMAADVTRSCPSCLFGNFNLLKPMRFYKDGIDVAAYLDDKEFPVSKLKYITVIYGYNDSVINIKRQVGVKDKKNPSQEEIEKFWNKFFPSAVKSGTQLNFKSLQGTHLGPAVYDKLYATTALAGTDQLK